MTDNNRPITPPEEVIDKWESEWHHCRGEDTYEVFMAKQAARWGADQELEACCEWLRSSLPGYDKHYADYLHTARRPKPPSLKEQASEELRKISISPELGVSVQALDTIRRALESLPD